ncbi:MAG: hypothetical protein QOD61_2632, partial [Solirubrobacteraceae bacterium]|nr:hypothetical protein [Solirubrobacteraceae bacterium]
MASRVLRRLRLAWVLPASCLALGGAAGPALASDGDGWTSPLNPSPASISGGLQVGETLSADPGTWTNDPDHFEYQWISCDGFRIACESIAGATGPTYVIGAADANRAIGLDVYSYPASRAWEWVRVAAVGPILASPTPASPPPASLSPPSVAGTPVEGGTLSADPGAWSGSPTSYRFQWYGCQTTLDGDGVSHYGCGTVPEASGAFYQLTEADLYTSLEVRVIATDAGGDSAVASSPATAIVLPLPATNTVRPVISAGPVQEGGGLDVVQGAWASSWSRTGETIEHQWLRCSPAGTDCSAIDGARGQVY